MKKMLGILGVGLIASTIIGHVLNLVKTILKAKYLIQTLKY